MRDAAEHARPLLTGLRQERSEARALLTPSWQERGTRYWAAKRRRAQSVANAAQAPSAPPGSGSSEASSK